MSPRMAETMRSARRVASTWPTRNTRAPSHAASAAVARLPAGSRSDGETSTGHPVPTSSRTISRPTMIRSRSTPTWAARPAEPGRHTTPARNSAATSASPAPEPRTRSAPAAHASRATSARPVLTPMTSPGWASRTAATNGTIRLISSRRSFRG